MHLLWWLSQLCPRVLGVLQQRCCPLQQGGHLTMEGSRRHLPVNECKATSGQCRQTKGEDPFQRGKVRWVTCCWSCCGELLAASASASTRRSPCAAMVRTSVIAASASANCCVLVIAAVLAPGVVCCGCAADSIRGCAAAGRAGPAGGTGAAGDGPAGCASCVGCGQPADPEATSTMPLCSLRCVLCCAAH